MDRRMLRMAWLLAALLGLTCCEVHAASQPLDGVVAIVNSEAITATELRAYVDQFTKPDRPADRELVDKTLNELINNKLLIQAARAEAITISQDDVDAEVARLASQFPTMTDYLMYLNDELHLTLRQQKQMIEQQLMRRRLIEKKLVKELFVPPAEIRQYYQEHAADFFQAERRHVRMISVFLRPDRTREAAHERIVDVQNRLNSGQDFASLAKQFSDDPRASEGGDYGLVDDQWILGPAASALQPGQVSDIVESSDGYHLIRVEAVLPAAQKTFREAQPEIARILRRQQTDALLEQYVRELRQKAYILIAGQPAQK